MKSVFYSKNIFRNIKYCIQRGRKGYCDADLWAIDRWFLDVMPPMLREFDKTRHSFPGSLQNEYIEKSKGSLTYDDFLIKFSNETEKYCDEKWSDLLNIMADDFEQLRKLYHRYDSKYDNEKEELKNEGLEMFCKWFFDLWD